MNSQLPQHLDVGHTSPSGNKEVVGLFESFKTMSTAHGVHHINHASGERWPFFSLQVQSCLCGSHLIVLYVLKVFDHWRRNN